MAWSRTGGSYDVSGMQVEPRWLRDLWSRDEVAAELRSRADGQLARDELVVDHYRIGHRWAFRLPLDRRPGGLPAGVPGVEPYPWLIWLAWELVERWDVLHGAATIWDDAAARRRMQIELAALADWEDHLEWGGTVRLPTGHLAMALARGLTLSGWDPELRRRALVAADSLLHKDVPAWYAETWSGAGSTQNIPMIVLCSVAALAHVVGDEAAGTYGDRAEQAVEDWFAARRAELLTEQTAYNGYLFDTVTQWLEVEQATGGRTDLVERWRAPLLELCPEWAQLSVPGRADLAAPLGDVETEMTMWLSCVARFTHWYGADATAGAAWLLRRCSPERLPAAALTLAIEQEFGDDAPPVPPASGTTELPAAVSIRTGAGHDDLLVAVGVGRHPMGHLHHDTGQVVVAWRGRTWVTDPGYQQYVSGQERDYTLGAAAHNVPVLHLPGAPEVLQTRKQGRVLGLDPVTLDLTGCYAGLDPAASIRRTVRVTRDGTEHVRIVVDDTSTGLPDGSSVTTHWLAGAGLAWAVVDGWVRWSDGSACVWLGTGTSGGREHLSADRVVRHPGSRGPIGTGHHGGVGQRQWQVVLDPRHGWDPPSW